MGYRGLVGQSAIEYLMTYGWMLLVVAIVGGAIFATVNQESPSSVTGFTGGDVVVEDYGTSTDEEIGLEVRSGTGDSVVISKVNVSDPDTGEYVYKEFTGDRKVDVGSSKIFELPNVSRSDGSNSLDVEIIYDSGGLSNLSVRGTVSGSIELTASGSYEGDPENDHQSIDTGGLSLLTTNTYTYTGSKETVDLENDFSEPVEEIKIVEMHGADGSDGSYNEGGSGGFISNASADLSSYSQLQIWVGETTGNDTGGWGRSDGGDGNGSQAGGGGGSTELWTGSDQFVAAADGGGGGADTMTGTDWGGGGGARGGLGGDATYDGQDAEGSGYGGNGGDVGDTGYSGGQELGIASLDSDGQTNTGGSDNGSGEITIEYYG